MVGDVVAPVVGWVAAMAELVTARPKVNLDVCLLFPGERFVQEFLYGPDYPYFFSFGGGCVLF